MDGSQGPNGNGNGYAGNVMLGAIVILFAVVVFMLCLHIYARWYLLRARRNRPHVRRRGGRRRTHIVFYVDPDNQPGATAVSASSASGLDTAVLSSLPLFVYSAETHPEALDCAVCLSEFEENEKGRLLPKCNHSFHIDCIDMWFHSHSTCPLCRSAVEPVSPLNRPDVVVSVGEPEHCLSCSGSSSSLADQRKAHERAIAALELPTRNASYDTDHELGLTSPTGQRLKSTTSRLQSLKRLLSVNRRAAAAVSTSSGIGASCGSATELDIECGGDEMTQYHSRVLTPR